MQTTINIESTFETAYKYHKSGDLQTAANAYQQILSSEPKHHKSLHYLGIIAQQLGKDNEAEQLFKYALESKPENEAEIQNDLGLLYLSKKRHSIAHRCFRKAIELKPKFADAHFNQGNTHFDQGNIEQAVLAYEKVVELTPKNEDVVFNLGLCAAALSQFDTAKQYFSLLGKKYNNYAQAQVNLGNIYYLEQNWDKAERHLETAIKTNPTLLEPHFNLGMVYHQQNKTPKALDFLSQFANALEDADHFEQAAKAYQQMIQISPQDPGVYYNLGTVLLNAGITNQAITILQQAIQLDVNFYQAHNNLGLAYQNQKNMERAKKAYLDAIAENNDFLQAYINLANLYLHMGNTHKAREYYQIVIAKDPDNAETYNNYGNVLRQSGLYEEAINAYQQSINIDASLAISHANLSEVLLSIGYLKQGWLEQEWRVNASQANKTYLPDPRNQNRILPKPSSYAGSDLSNKIILLTYEQDIIDFLFNLRFVEQTVKQGAHVEILAPKELREIIARSTPFTMVAEENIQKNYDHILSITDLPLLLNTSDIPLPLNLIPDENYVDKIAQLLTTEYINLPVLGVSWQKEININSKIQDSLTPYTLGKSLRNWPGSIIILQSNADIESIAAFNSGLGREAHNFSTQNSSFEDMLAILSLIDEFVGINDIKAYLCGSLGKSAKILTPNTAKWHWQVESEKTVWYPDFTVYRQSYESSWSNALAKLSMDF